MQDAIREMVALRAEGRPRRGDRRRRAGEGPVIGRALFDRGQRLAGHLSEGMNLFPQRERLGREASMLEGIPIALGSAASSPMHPAYLIPPNRWRSAPEAAPLRFGVASQCPAHIQEHEVVPSIFRLPLPPGPLC